MYHFQREKLYKEIVSNIQHLSHHTARPIWHLCKLKKVQNKDSEKERERHPDSTRRLENKTIGSALVNYLTKWEHEEFRNLPKEEFLNRLQTDLQINSQTRQKIEIEVQEEKKEIEEERQRSTGRPVKNMKKVRSGEGVPDHYSKSSNW